MTYQDVRNIYGDAKIVKGTELSKTFRYGDTVEFKIFMNRVNYIKTTANNGFATPSGLRVGMKKADMERIYGEAHYIEYDKKTGLYNGMYGHNGNGAGASMVVYWDKKGVIKSIECVC